VSTLVLNHLIPADDPEIGESEWLAAVRKTWAGDLTIARDGLVVELSGAKAAPGEGTA
jgi:ribonuclease BN (tRNA processing enzyme)